MLPADIAPIVVDDALLDRYLAQKTTPAECSAVRRYLLEDLDRLLPLFERMRAQSREQLGLTDEAALEPLLAPESDQCVYSAIPASLFDMLPGTMHATVDTALPQSRPDIRKLLSLLLSDET